MPYKTEKIGIYQIKNLIDGKLYIGGSVSIKRRFSLHKHLLNHNKHFNQSLQASWNTCGNNNFEFSVIIECEKDKLDFNESHFIAINKSNNSEFGFNKRIDCKTNAGNKLSPETKKKISEYQINHKRPNQKKISEKICKPVFQIGLDLKIVNEFDSIKQAAEFTGFSSSSISTCTTRKIKSHPRNQYYWCFKSEYSTFTKPSYKCKSRYKKK